MKKWICTTLVVMTIAVTAPVAQAKSLSRMVAELGLSPADFEIMGTAANSLFAGGRPSTGQEVAWANDDTGAKGTVRVREMRDNCAQLQYVFTPGGADASREIRTRRCLDANGKWVLTP